MGLETVETRKSLERKRDDILLTAMSRSGPLSEAAQRAVLALPSATRSFERGKPIIEQHDQPSHCALLIDGFAAGSQFTHAGRQYTAVRVPGDIMDVYGMALPRPDQDIVALTYCRVAYIPHAALAEAAERFAVVNRHIWYTLAMEGMLQRAWIVSMGRRSASRRLAHLICELTMRLKAVGLADDNGFDFPIVQYELADILGISAVHANRAVQGLRALRLISWQKGHMTLPDFPALIRFAEFDPELFPQPDLEPAT